MSDLPDSCERFIAVIEGQLDHPPSAELMDEAQAHAAQCSECAALAGALQLMSAPVPLSPEEHLAYRQAALEGEHDALRRHRRRPLLWAIAASLAGIAVGLMVWRYVAVFGDSTAPAELALAQPWCGKTRLVGGETHRPCAGAELLTLADGSRLRLERRSALRVVRADRGEYRLRLERGRLVLQVASVRDRRFVVETACCEARVVGTVFEVRVVDGDAEVAVVEGTVEVESVSVAAVERLQGGWQLRVRTGTREPLAPQHRHAIVAALAASQPVVDASLPALPADAGPPAIDARAPRPPRKAALAEPRQLLARARRCRGAGDLPCARQAYLQLQKHTGVSGVAITALVALAEVELEMSLGAAALRHSRRYLRLRPKGALAQEALFAELRALRLLGRRKAERQAVERFIERFPHGIHTNALKARLGQLGD